MFFKKITDKLKEDLGTQLVLIGLLIGLLSGFASVLYRWLIEAVQQYSFGTERMALNNVQAAIWWRRILIPVLGGLLVGAISKIFLKSEGPSHGLPDVMEAIQHEKTLPKRIILVRALTSALTIGSGGSTGKEGPIAHIGSTIGSAVSALFKKKGEFAKTMIACGAAGGIAATFNAPITGALFALEIIHGDVAIRHFTPVVISSVIATVISNSLISEGANFPALSSGKFIFNLHSGYEIPLYMLMALLAGFFSILFVVTLEKGEDWFGKLKMPGYLKPALGGFLLALIALFFPQLHGFSDYTTINNALENQYLWYVVGLLSLLKILTTALTLGSGGTGGVFAPCLMIGAMMGDTFGYWVHRLFPNATASSGSYALVGMGAVMAGVTQAPLTSMVLIFELTGKYTIILPLMIACAVSTLMVQGILHGSIFTLHLKKKGIFYGERRNALRRLRVGELMKEQFTTVSPEMPFRELLTTLTHSKQYAFPVVDVHRRVVGIVSLQDYQEMVFEKDVADVLVVGDVMTREVISVRKEESLEDALLKIGERNIEYLPVVESYETLKIVGLISRRDILSCYNRELKSMKLKTIRL